MPSSRTLDASSPLPTSFESPEKVVYAGARQMNSSSVLSPLSFSRSVTALTARIGAPTLGYEAGC